MKKYNVWASIKYCGIIQVEADSEEEAKKKAWQLEIKKTDLPKMLASHTSTDILDILEVED